MDQDSQSATAPLPGQGADHALSERAVSVDEIAKIRLWHLIAQAQQIFRQTIFADTKAATVLALVGLVGARVAVSIPSNEIDLFIAVVFLNKALVLIACLAVIMPRIPRGDVWIDVARREQFSWAALAGPEDGRDYGHLAAHADAETICASIANANRDSAHVLRDKFIRLRIAFQLAMLDIVLTIGVFLMRGI